MHDYGSIFRAAAGLVIVAAACLAIYGYVGYVRRRSRRLTALIEALLASPYVKEVKQLRRRPRLVYLQIETTAYVAVFSYCPGTHFFHYVDYESKMRAGVTLAFYKDAGGVEEWLRRLESWEPSLEKCQKPGQRFTSHRAL